MRRLYKVLLGCLVVIGAVVIALGVMLSRNGACPATPAPQSGADRMEAVYARCYGSADVLKVESVPKPVPADNEVLVRVRAAGINPLDWHFMRGTPYLIRLQSGVGLPKDPRTGADFAGVVDSVGRQVTRFKPGDEVYGQGDGTLAQFITIRESGGLAPKPAAVTFEQAAAVPIAGVTALQALRDQAHVQAGQKVLINGASGGVGTFAVQIAKAMGGEVTGVCSTRNVALVQSLGADHVVDYTRDDFTRLPEQYDVIIDNVVNHSLWDYRHVLKPTGVLVIVGGGSASENPWYGAFTAMIKAAVESPFVSARHAIFIADVTVKDLTALNELMASGKLTPELDHPYTLDQAAQAMAYLEQGHARGKVVIDVP